MNVSRRIRTFKATRTPDCECCEHFAGTSSNNRYLMCNCPALSLAVRKCLGEIPENDTYQSKLIRGNKYCKFKRKGK